MGFWDSAKEFGNKMGEEAQVIKRLKEYSDNKLIEIVKAGAFSSYSSSEKKWAKRILEQRGIRVN